MESVLESEIRRYRSKAALVVPGGAKKSLHKYSESILGFNLESSKFDNPRLESIVAWINKRFSSCIVLLGDSIHRITLRIVHGISEAEARAMAKSIADQTVARAWPVLMNEGNSRKFGIVRCSEIDCLPECASYYAQMCDMFEGEGKFRSSVLNFAREFLARGERAGNGLAEANIRLSCNYLLEELAILEFIARRGKYVLVYPGSLTTVIEMSNGEYPNGPEGLQKLGMFRYA